MIHAYTETKSVDFSHPVTGDEVAVGNLVKRGDFGCATVDGVGAARSKGTTGRGIEWAWNITLQDNSLI